MVWCVPPDSYSVATTLTEKQQGKSRQQKSRGYARKLRNATTSSAPPAFTTTSSHDHELSRPTSSHDHELSRCTPSNCQRKQQLGRNRMRTNGGDKSFRSKQRRPGPLNLLSSAATSAETDWEIQVHGQDRVKRVDIRGDRDGKSSATRLALHQTRPQPVTRAPQRANGAAAYSTVEARCMRGGSGSKSQISNLRVSKMRRTGLAASVDRKELQGPCFAGCCSPEKRANVSIEAGAIKIF